MWYDSGVVLIILYSPKAVYLNYHLIKDVVPGAFESNHAKILA